MPCNYKDYPPDWKTEIVPRILRRAGEIRDEFGNILIEARCEFCGEINHLQGIRKADGSFDCMGTPEEVEKGERYIRIILTVAHLDHDKENWEISDDRLKALCQRCHLNYDRPRHVAKRKSNRERRQMKLFEASL